MGWEEGPLLHLPPPTKLLSEECGNQDTPFPTSIASVPEKRAATRSPQQTPTRAGRGAGPGPTCTPHPSPMLTNVGVLQQAADAGFTLQLLVV